MGQLTDEIAVGRLVGALLSLSKTSEFLKSFFFGGKILS